MCLSGIIIVESGAIMQAYGSNFIDLQISGAIILTGQCKDLLLVQLIYFSMDSRSLIHGGIGRN